MVKNVNVHMFLTVSLFPFYMTKDFGHLTLSSIYTHSTGPNPLSENHRSEHLTNHVTKASEREWLSN